MALTLSPLSQVCKGIRAYLDVEINSPTTDKVAVLLATPAETSSNLDTLTTPHSLNLFFYRFEPSGLFPDTLPGETGWLRSYCLITPFAGSGDSIGAGENDLRLIGEVARIFHEKPVFLLSVDGQDYHIQVIFQPLGLDQLNQLWSTQGDTVYRPSVLYEISLAPVIPAKPAPQSSLVGNLGLGVSSDLQTQPAGAPIQNPEVPVMAPDIARHDWTPAIAFVQGGVCAFSLGFALNDPALAAFTPRVWLAGKAGESVSLHWQSWDANSGWSDGGSTPVSIADTRIDPDAAGGAATGAIHSLALPFKDHVGQMLLHAERTVTRAGDGVQLTLRSNPLLVSLHDA